MKTKNIVKCCILILIISYYIIIESNTSTLGKEQLTTDNCGYRLGDMVTHKIHRSAPKGKYGHHLYYPHSIATEYMQKTSKSNQINILHGIVIRRTKPELVPDPGSLVIHIRIGDVIDEQKESVDDFLNDYVAYTLSNGISKKNYVKPIKYYEKALKYFNNIDHIILVGGFHYKRDHTKSLEYVDKLSHFFQSKSFTVETRINKDPDDDFIFMCNAKNFIQSGGGYSNLIGKIVKKKHNKIYYDNSFILFSSNLVIILIITIIITLFIII